jgi:diacylglycerol kinase
VEVCGACAQRIDTVLLLALMGLVLVAELLNSGLEAIVDMASPDIHPLAAKAKDCGSAAVFVAPRQRPQMLDRQAQM